MTRFITMRITLIILNDDDDEKDDKRQVGRIRPLIVYPLYYHMDVHCARQKLPKGGIGTIRHNYDNDDEKDDKRRQVEVGSIGPLIVYPLYYHIDVHCAWQK